MQKMHDMTGNETENCKCWHKKHKQFFSFMPSRCHISRSLRRDFGLNKLLDTILLSIRHGPGCCDIVERDPGQTNTSPLEGRLERENKYTSKIWNNVFPYEPDFPE